MSPRLSLAVLLVACSGGGSQAKGSGKANGAPVVVGFVNQENAAVGSFPEVRADAEAAVRYVNAELGGVGGHPLRLESCVTDGTPALPSCRSSPARRSRPGVPARVVQALPGARAATAARRGAGTS